MTIPHAAAERAVSTRTIRGKFVKFPTAVLYEPSVPDEAKVTYAVLIHYAWTEGSSTFELGTEELATLLDRSPDQATRRTRKLESLDPPLLRVERRRGHGHRNRYTVLDPHGCGFLGRTPAASSSRTDAGSGSRTDAGSYKREEDETRTKTSALPEWCGECDSTDYRWREQPDGSWSKCWCFEAPKF